MTHIRRKGAGAPAPSSFQPKKATARQLAYTVLERVEKEGAHADLLLDRELRRHDLSPPDRRLATELVYGILRRSGTLDYVIGQVSSKAHDRLDLPVLVLLRLGLYQLFFTDRIPASAAVNETVNLAAVITPHAKGFINACLRAAGRLEGGIPWPDRSGDLPGFLAVRHSHPRWLVERWLQQLGPEEGEALAAAMAEPAPLTIRANTVRISRDDLVRRLEEEGVHAKAAVFAPDALHLPERGRVADLPSFRDGLFTVQDESSQVAALLLDPQPGERVLDCCAAPGGKATYLAQLMKNEGEVVAADLHDVKLPLITETAERLGLSIVHPIRMDISRQHPELAGQFRRVLLDAPCSAFGVIRRNPESKWRRTPADVARLAQGQKTMLRNAAELVAPGGTLVYSTCSTMPEEDEAVVDDFLSAAPDFVLEDLRPLFPPFRELISDRGMFRSWPHRHGMDGFFAARFRRIS